MGMMIMIAFCKTGEVIPAPGLIPPGLRAPSLFCDDCVLIPSNTNNHIMTMTVSNFDINLMSAVPVRRVQIPVKTEMRLFVEFVLQGDAAQSRISVSLSCNT